jgi:hypothetical protein
MSMVLVWQTAMQLRFTDRRPVNSTATLDSTHSFIRARTHSRTRTNNTATHTRTTHSLDHEPDLSCLESVSHSHSHSASSTLVPIGVRPTAPARHRRRQSIQPGVKQLSDDRSRGRRSGRHTTEGRDAEVGAPSASCSQQGAQRSSRSVNTACLSRHACLPMIARLTLAPLLDVCCMMCR